VRGVVVGWVVAEAAVGGEVAAVEVVEAQEPGFLRRRHPYYLDQLVYIIKIIRASISNGLLIQANEMKERREWNGTK
jgi:hypothetical protein